MNISSIAYLLRYVLALFVFVVAFKLLKSAIKELRWSMRHSLRPAQGYYLLGQKSDGSTISLPLYHTTNIGKARSNDLRINNPDIARHHAVIYRYDNNWFIRPQNMSAQFSINGELVKGETQLKNGDYIDFYVSKFAFVDEPMTAEARGEIYEESDYDNEAFLRAVKRNSNPPYIEWLLINLFTALTSAIIFFSMPELEELRKSYLIYTTTALLITDFIFLILPMLLRYADRILFLAAAQLSVIGVAIQGRLNLLSNPAYIRAEAEGSVEAMQEIAKAMFSNYRTQIIALCIGMIILMIGAIIVAKTKVIENLLVFCAVITPLLLLITLIFGRGGDTHGATLWLSLGGHSLQLTEFAKISYLITLAGFFKNRPPLRTQIKFAIWAAMIFFMYLLLPDLGSLMILVPTTLIVFVIMTSEYIKTALILVAAAVMSVVGYGLFGHVRRRIDGWTSLWTEVNDSNRQVVYGLQAMGRGNITGRGLGNGSPGGIPLAKSDMIFSVICEEFGIIVGISIFVILFVILLRGFRTNILARDGFSSALGLALGTVLFVEALVVIGGTTGLIPLTGATLLFIAAGGSSMLAKWIVIALLLGLASRQEGGNR